MTLRGIFKYSQREKPGSAREKKGCGGQIVKEKRDVFEASTGGVRKSFKNVMNQLWERRGIGDNDRHN